MNYTELVDKYLEKANEQAKFDHNTARELGEVYPISLNRDYIVKVLDTPKLEMVTEYPVGTGEKDPKTGGEKYEIKTKKEMVDNPIGEAIIIALPSHPMTEAINDYVVGEHVLFIAKTAMPFHWVPNTHIIGGFNIVGRVKPNMVKATNEDETTNEAKAELPKFEADINLAQTESTQEYITATEVDSDMDTDFPIVEIAD